MTIVRDTSGWMYGCVYPVADRLGIEEPCEKKGPRGILYAVSPAPPDWRGPYCLRHARSAQRYCNAEDARGEDAWD